MHDFHPDQEILGFGTAFTEASALVSWSDRRSSKNFILKIFSWANYFEMTEPKYLVIEDSPGFLYGLCFNFVPSIFFQSLYFGENLVKKHQKPTGHELYPRFSIGVPSLDTDLSQIECPFFLHLGCSPGFSGLRSSASTRGAGALLWK